MGLPENTGVWTNPFFGNLRLLVDFSTLVLAWHPILARASTSGTSIHFWLERQHLLQAPTTVSDPCF